MFVKKCERFDCKEPAVLLISIAPGTSVWLCKKCLEEFQNEQNRRMP